MLETISFWSKVAVAVCGVLTAIAVALALYFSSKVAALKNAELERVHAASQVAVASAEVRARDAMQSAAAAHALAAAANERAAQLEVEAAQQQARDAGAQREPTEAQLQPGIAPRHVTVEQRKIMVSMLKTARLPQQIELSWVASPESYAFAKEVWGVLQDAGWTVTATGGVLTPSSAAGVCLTASAVSNETLLLQSALEAIGVPLQMVLQPELPEGHLKLSIGLVVESGLPGG
jgi:hypothetical protein